MLHTVHISPQYTQDAQHCMWCKCSCENTCNHVAQLLAFQITYIFFFYVCIYIKAKMKSVSLKHGWIHKGLVIWAKMVAN